MRTIFVIALILTVVGAISSVVYGMTGNDLFTMVVGEKRTIGGDFVRILVGLSAVITLVFGLRMKGPSKP